MSVSWFLLVRCTHTYKDSASQEGLDQINSMIKDAIVAVNLLQGNCHLLLSLQITIGLQAFSQPLLPI